MGQRFQNTSAFPISSSTGVCGWSSHRVRRKVVTNKLIRLLLIFVSLIVILINGAAIYAGVGLVANKTLFVVHVARLYAKAPDQNLEMPVQGVTKSQIADTWHAPREGDRLHEGQDIFAKRGTPVLSATDGYVLRIGENTLGGQTVSVIGAGGRIYYYAHLDSYAPNIAIGDRVTTQTVLGYVGNTGNAAGGPTHLHFGVYARDGALNPLPLLSDRPEDKSTLKIGRSKKSR
ncbi:MAG: peptidase M23 [Acidobacteria bacterium]|nr:MAG: peptidase M23 [Acidobacteriota bacterium]